MTTGQTIEAKITVDGKQAIAEMAKFDQEMKAAEKATREADAALKAFEKTQRDAVSAVTAIDQRIAKYERDMMALGAAILSGQGNTKAYEAELRQLGRELDALSGKTVATTNKTQDFARAAADVETHGRGGGMAMLEMSRAFEDAQYGINGVLNNIPGLLMSLGAGAGLTGIVSAAAVGVSMLAKNFGGLDPAAKEAAAAAKEHVKSLRDEITGLQVDLRVLEVGAQRAAMEAQAKKIEEAAKEAAPLIEAIGRDTFNIMLEQQRAGFKQQDPLLAAISFMGADVVTRQKMKERGAFVSEEAFQAAVAAQEKLDLELSKMAGLVRKQNEENAQREIDLAVDRANAITEIEQNAANNQVSSAKKGANEKQQAEIDAWKMRTERDKTERKAKLSEIEEDRQIALDRANAIFKAEEDRAKESAKELKRIRKEQADAEEQIAKDKAKALKAIEKQQQDFFVGAAQGAFSNVLSASQGYIEAKIKGEKDAEQKAVASFLSATGQQLVGSGTRAIFEGLIANAAIPGSGIPLMATGAAAIAAGIGMGAGGAAVSASVAGGGGSGEKMAARDRGASPRSSSGGGSGGPLVINVSYGVGGPLPEDTAREIAKVMRTGDRRRGAA
jgi:hypothetical protein